ASSGSSGTTGPSPSGATWACRYSHRSASSRCRPPATLDSPRSRSRSLRCIISSGRWVARSSSRSAARDATLTDHPPKQLEEDDSTVAKKAQKRSAPKKAATKSAKVANRPAAKAAKAPAASKRTSVPAGPATSAHHSGLGERVQHLHEEIRRSKLTHPNPWTYAPKARAWDDRAQVLVEMIVVQGYTPVVVRTLETLHAEVEADRDFQDAPPVF